MRLLTNFAIAAVACAIALALGACGGETAAASAGTETRNPDVLRIALLPDEDPSTVITKNKAFKAYLEQQIGKPIDLVVTTDYSSMIEAMANKRIDLGYFGPLSYCLAQTKAAISPFAAKTDKGSATYKSVLVVAGDAGITQVTDIAGKVVAWGDQASTSSHLIPKSILQAEGLMPGEDYQEHFVGSHDAVALAIQNGNAQAGGLSLPIYESLLARGIIDATKVVKLQESKPFPQYPWSMQNDLDPSLKAVIVKTFLELKDPEILETLKADGFVEISDSAYDVVRDLAKILNLDLAKM
jgi:phosphonate transport system substrate-binding protein